METFENYGIDLPKGFKRGNVKCFCPACRDRRKNHNDRSLSVNIDKGVWKCHYCGWEGSLKYTDEEKREWARRQQQWTRPASVADQKPEFTRPTPRPQTPMSENALVWFASRGISQATLQALQVTEGQEWMPQKQTQVNTVQFNYYLNGELVNTKFRTGDKCFKLCSGAELIPYNIDAIKGQPECIITEGEMDALSFHEAGLPWVVSVPNGANANLAYLDNFMADYFDDKETIYIAVDTDTKGVELRGELIRRFGAERCRVVTFGDDSKDANEHLVAHGEESLRQCLEQSPEIKIEGIFTLSDVEEELDAMYEHGLQKGVTIGHDNVDQYISFETKRLCLVTGYPTSGKSEFIDEIAERLNIRYGWRFAYFSPENQPLKYHLRKLIDKFAGRAFSKSELSSPAYIQAKAHINKNFFFILPENSRVDTILEKAKYLVRRKGIKALVIDPYNRLEDEKGGQKETDYVSRLLDKLTKLALKYPPRSPPKFTIKFISKST